MDISSELVIALVGGTGTNFDEVVNYINGLLKGHYNEIHSIKLSELPNKYVKYNKKFEGSSYLNKIAYYQDQCDKLAKVNPAIMGVLAVCDIHQRRIKGKSNAFIVKSLKRNDEFKVLRRIYNHNLILISIYEPKEHREKHLINKEIINNANDKYADIETKARKTIERDNHDGNNKFGQSVRETYTNAAYFVRYDTLEEDIKRLLNILLGDPIETPNKDEVGMAHAHVSAMRSSDLYRQVGAVITNDDGSILATGCNEVPKFGGGSYWNENNGEDLRDYFVHKQGKPLTLCIKEDLADDIFKDLKNQLPKQIRKSLEKYKEKIVTSILKKGVIKDMIEFLRPIHGEEAAICDAALRGISTKDATLYCNTYPCHLCTKKIIACGIKRVVYIDPYPKSKAEILYKDIMIDKPLKPEQSFNKVVFESYRGCSPKRYPHLFNLKYIKRYDKTTGLINPRENIGFHNELIYVTHYSPLGYIQKEIAYITWLKSMLLKNLRKKNLFQQDHNIEHYFSSETNWLNQTNKPA